jgi:uncharacterized membrane protein YqhA
MNKNFFDKYFEPFFYKTKYIALIAVIGIFILSLLLFIVGLSKSIDLIINFDLKEDTKHLKISIISIADLFLFGMAMLILSFGTYKLFIGKITPDVSDSIPVWLQNITDFGKLKIIVAKIVVLVLILIFLELVIENFNQFIHGSLYELLIIPLGALLIAVGLKIVEKLE